MITLIFAAEGGHAENGYQFPHAMGEVWIGSLALFIVLALLYKLAGPAIAGGLKGRTNRIETALADAKAARETAEAALDASTAELPDVSEEEARILAEARQTAEKLKVDLVAQAERDAEEYRARGKVEVENFRRQAVADLTNEVAAMTRGAANAIVNETLNDSAQADLIDSYISQLEQAV